MRTPKDRIDITQNPKNKEAKDGGSVPPHEKGVGSDDVGSALKSEERIMGYAHFSD